MNNIINIKSHGNIAIITLDCELDASVSEKIKEHIQQEINDDIQSFIINMSQVPFVDSHGVGLFASLLKNAYARNGVLSFSGVEGQPESLLKLVGFNDKLVNYYKNTEEALQALSK